MPREFPRLPHALRLVVLPVRLMSARPAAYAEQLELHAVVPRRPAEMLHAQAPADCQRPSVVRAYHGEDLLHAVVVGIAQRTARRLAREPLSPRVRVEVPAYLDLSLAVREGNEDHGAEDKAILAALHGPSPAQARRLI